jgi:hypothetical protein
VQVGERTFLGSLVGICQNVRPRSGPGTWFRLVRLAAAYLLILAFVAPSSFAGTQGHRNQKSGRHQRANHRPSAAAKAVITLAAYRCRSPERDTPFVAGTHPSLLSPAVLTPAVSQNSYALPRVFRPLRC